MFEKFMFEGKRKDGNGDAKGYFFVLKKYGKSIPIIGEGFQNGSVNGFEVIPETVQHLTGDAPDNGGDGICPMCGDKLFCAMCGEHIATTGDAPEVRIHEAVCDCNPPDPIPMTVLGKCVGCGKPPRS